MSQKMTGKNNKMDYPISDESKSKHFIEWAAKQIHQQIEKAALEYKKTGKWPSIEELKKL